MIDRFERIPETEVSKPYARAAVKCRFGERGFTEEEYFIHGTANVYATQNGKPEIVYAGASYVNRILVRRPVEAKRFSGNVVVEILNATNYMDVDRIWCLVREKILRDGDIYIGITSRPVTIPVMQKFDSERYQALSWKNPREATLPDEQLGNGLGESHGWTEDGLIWDMLRELPDALRNLPDSPLRDYGGFYIYLSGWSQSGGYMIRFVNSFAYLNPENIRKPIYDGYFSGGSAGIVTPGLNQEESLRTAAPGKEVPWRLEKCFQPYMEIHTETENTNFGTKEANLKNSDAEDFKYRRYDIPGASHDSKDNWIDYYHLDPDLSCTGIFPNYGGKEPYANDYPYNFIFHRALHMLFDWVREGKRPPVLPLILLDAEGKNVRDQNGNVCGGWRTAFLEYPTCVYCSTSTPLKPEFAFACTCFGHKEPFSAEELKRRYGTLANYRSLVSAMASDQVKEGLLEKADEEAYISLAVEAAKNGGLK